MKKNYYFVSPHYDDAIGACGALIADMVFNKKNVTVLTVFAGNNKTPLSMYAKKLHKKWGITDIHQREDEDCKACRRLGCKSKKMRFMDAIYRRNDSGESLYPSSASLFSSLCKEDILLQKQILNCFLEQFDSNTAFYFPLGKGGHVDHVITHWVGKKLKENGYDVTFYVDFFYNKTKEISSDYFVYKVSVHLQELKVLAMLEYRSQLPTLYRKRTEAEIRECLFEEAFDRKYGTYVERYSTL